MTAPTDDPAVEAGTRTGPGEGGSSAYRPHLDGLRAIAVYLVLVFHADVIRLSGGFIGVDVFFVLSGYLVTQLLLRDLDRRDSVDLPRFYGRRFRRLLPAAAVVLVATAFVYPLFASPLESLDAVPGLRAASLYYSNWYFIHASTDYFAANVQSSPVLHFWSLSVEEQFYLGWPLLFTGLFAVAGRFGPRRNRFVFGIVAVAMVASLGAALWFSRTNINRAYYGTDTRAYQLLAGALLAMAPLAFGRRWPLGRVAGVGDRARPARWPTVVSIAALGVVLVTATSHVHIGPIGKGIIATVATLALIVSLEPTSNGLVKRLLSGTTIVYLGRISYGIYLWHWLVILLITATMSVTPVVTALLAAGAATGLASLSYQVLEMPIRQAGWLDRRRIQVIGSGLAVSLLVGLLVAPQLLERTPTRPASEAASETTADARGVAPVPANLDWKYAAADHGAFPVCPASDPQKCIQVDGGEPHVLLLGDSNARMYLPTFEQMAKDRGFTLSAALGPGCLWMQGIVRTEETYDQPCRQRQREWYRTIVPALDPDVIVLVHRAIDDPANPTPIVDVDRGALEMGSKEMADAVRRRADATVKALQADGRKVVIIEPAPVSRESEDQVKCLSEATYLDECRFVTSRQPTPVEQVYRDLDAKDPSIRLVNLDPILCPFLPICDPVVDGMVVRWDPAHITTRFARAIAPKVDALLQSERIYD